MCTENKAVPVRVWPDDHSKQAPKSSYDKWDWECHHMKNSSFLFDDKMAENLFPTGPVVVEAEGRFPTQDNFHPETWNMNLLPPEFSKCKPRVKKSKFLRFKYLKPWTISAYEYSTYHQ